MKGLWSTSCRWVLLPTPELLGLQTGWVLASCCALHGGGLLGLRAGFGALPFQICANLDTEVIASAQEHAQHLQSHVSQPTKQYDLCQEREQVRGGGLSPQRCSL